MKIVINKCWGGFGISNEAILELINMKSKIVDKEKIKKYYGGDNPNFERDWQEEWHKDKIRLKPFKSGFFIHPYLDGILYDNEFVYSIYNDDNIRSNPDLIKVIKKLKDKASGKYSKLVIVEIPNKVKFKINNYDGMESIHEKHKVWS